MEGNLCYLFNRPNPIYDGYAEVMFTKKSLKKLSCKNTLASFKDFIP